MKQNNNINNVVNTEIHFREKVSQKHKISIKFVLTLLQFFFIFTLGAQITFKYVSVNNLNLREEPNISSKVLTTLPKWTEVKMEEDCKCEWIRVSYDGNIGYVFSKYLTNSKQIDESSTSSNVKYYTNSRGEKVQSPIYSNVPPKGATALCRDGTYSFSRNRRGTCSHHGGVSKWL
ncbi:MAG: DUF3761 domain-containing protein [Bacteroidales bacterium]|jgi:uncharacterized protein YgiM (DUF1202 family)|nr:DUF3761 domain-containing protein [Bacteroidales bacterium]